MSIEGIFFGQGMLPYPSDQMSERSLGSLLKGRVSNGTYDRINKLCNTLPSN